MKIIAVSKDLTPKETYQLTMSPETQKMSDADGQIIEIKAWAIYTDTDSKGEEKEILSIMTPEDEIFGTISPTFKGDFIRMQELFAGMGEIVQSIKVSSGQSKAGRTFITCVYEA